MSGNDGEQRSVISLDDLGLEQLSSLQKQIEREITFFTESVQQLRLVAAKMSNSCTALHDLGVSPPGHSALIPLSESMYIRAELSDPNTTLVEIGTGYYAEMNTEKAMDFFQRKEKYITAQIDKVDTLLRERNATRAKITDKIQLKVRSALATQPSA